MGLQMSLTASVHLGNNSSFMERISSIHLQQGFSVFLSIRTTPILTAVNLRLSIFPPIHELASQCQECRLKAALTDVKVGRVVPRVGMATICAHDYFLSSNEQMHAHAGKAGGKQQGSKAGVNNNTAVYPSSLPTSRVILTPV